MVQRKGDERECEEGLEASANSALYRFAKPMLYGRRGPGPSSCSHEPPRVAWVRPSRAAAELVAIQGRKGKRHTARGAIVFFRKLFRHRRARGNEAGTIGAMPCRRDASFRCKGGKGEILVEDDGVVLGLAGLLAQLQPATATAGGAARGPGERMALSSERTERLSRSRRRSRSIGGAVRRTGPGPAGEGVAVALDAGERTGRLGGGGRRVGVDRTERSGVVPKEQL